MLCCVVHVLGQTSAHVSRLIGGRRHSLRVSQRKHRVVVGANRRRVIPVHWHNVKACHIAAHSHSLSIYLLFTLSRSRYPFSFAYLTQQP